MKILNVSHAILLLLVFIGYQLFMINGAIASIPRFSDTQDGERPDKMPDHVWNTPIIRVDEIEKALDVHVKNVPSVTVRNSVDVNVVPARKGIIGR
ncbi:hypothetical protein N9236_00440 [bacterium]|nr:hypothetical protein [bacterium]MDB4776570.1 hypothetical protein [Akkermansiaceae bacterium]